MKSKNAKISYEWLNSGSDQFQNTISVRDWPSTATNRLIVIHNASQVQLDVELPNQWDSTSCWKGFHKSSCSSYFWNYSKTNYIIWYHRKMLV